MKKELTVLLLSALMLLSLAACGSSDTEEDEDTAAETEETGDSGETEEAEESEEEISSDDEDSHIDIALFTYIEGMDPATDWCGWNLTRCGVGETLVTVNEDMEIVGQLADEWEQVDDVTYRFHIRQGVQFSNGTELTAEIVKDSIQRALDNNTRASDLKIESIEVEDEYVIFTTTEPYSAFVAQLTEPMTVIVDTTVDTSNYDEYPICTGPYIIEEYVSEEKIELVANENYWDGAPSIKSITVKNIDDDTKVDGILSGDLDLAQGPSATSLSRVEDNDEVEIITVTGTRENDFELNCREDNPLSDVNLRLALSYSVDREVIAEIAGEGYASELTTAFPSSVGYDSDSVNGQSYDLDLALEYLEAAGYSDEDGNGYVEKDGEELVLTISLSSSSNTAISEALQDMWGEIGIHIELELLESLSDIRESGDFDIIASPSWQTMNAGDGQKYLMNRWSEDGSDNYSGYYSEEFEAILDTLDAAFDTDERIDAFVEAQQILADDCPAIYLYASDNVTIMSSDLENVTIFPIDYYLVTNNWTLAE